MKKLIRFIKNEEGVVFIEYALIAALIAVALIAVTIALKDEISAIFTYIAGKLSDAQTN